MDKILIQEVAAVAGALLSLKQAGAQIYAGERNAIRQIIERRHPKPKNGHFQFILANL